MTGGTVVEDTLELLELYAALDEGHREQVLWVARQLAEWEREPPGLS